MKIAMFILPRAVFAEPPKLLDPKTAHYFANHSDSIKREKEVTEDGPEMESGYQECCVDFFDDTLDGEDLPEGVTENLDDFAFLMLCDGRPPFGWPRSFFAENEPGTVEHNDSPIVTVHTKLIMPDASGCEQ